MFFRFAAGLLLVVLVSMAGVRLEKHTLQMRRDVSVQYYQTDLLLELLVRLRLETQRLTAPAQLAATMSEAAGATNQRTPGASPKPRMETAIRPDSQDEKVSRPSDDDRLPLLRFQYPFNPEGID